MENTEEQQYAINLDWFEQNNASFTDSAVRRVCSSCKKKLSPEKKDSAKALIKTISDCCHKEKDYIHSQQPLVESIFRLFLSTGNKPLTVDEIMLKVNEKRPDNPVAISTEALQKLLDSNRFLGIGPAKTQPGA